MSISICISCILLIVCSKLDELLQVLEMVFKSLKNVCKLEVYAHGMRVLPDVFGPLRHHRSDNWDFY